MMMMMMMIMVMMPMISYVMSCYVTATHASKILLALPGAVAEEWDHLDGEACQETTGDSHRETQEMGTWQ